jgi:ABC-type nitrate/sulfonate/bicarbonate transport system permease component
LIKKLRSITGKLSAAAAVAVILLVWQALSSAGVVPRFMLPSPVDVVRAFVGDFGVLMVHSATTLQEAFLGLAIGVALAFCAAVAMDRVPFLYKALYPVLVITQTIPTVAIAPLLVLWLGYDMAPKVTLVVIVCFFPIAVNLLDGFRSADPDTLTLLRSMGAGKGQLFRFAKLPAALGHFFAGLRVSVSYSVVGAVIAEWLGGRAGLGVYMTQVRKSYAYDKMFAVIFLVSLISLLLMKGVTLLRNACMPWERAQKRDAG